MMQKDHDHNHYFIFLPKNPVEGIFIIAALLLLRIGKIFYAGPPPSYLLFIQKFPLVGKILKNKVLEHENYIGDYKGLWYEISELVIKFTNEFYDENRNELTGLVNYLNKKFSTCKFEAFVKKRISLKIFELLKVLYLANNFGKKNLLILNGDKLTRCIAGKFRDQYASDMEVEFFNIYSNIFLFFDYVRWITTRFVKQGFSWRRKRPYFKLLVEATSGFSRKVLRDDMLIDGKYFTKEDVLFCQFHRKDPNRNKAFNEVKKRGYHTISSVNTPINIRINFLQVLYRYFVVPLILYIKLLATGCSYLLYDLLQFFTQGFPVEVLMNSCNIGVNISFIDNDDIGRTIIFNNYGVVNSIFHWSDLTVFKAFTYAFIAHNIYFTWGDIHYDYHSENFFVDEKVNIGCIFKEEYNRAVKNKDGIILQLLGTRRGRIVTFFDNSYNKYTPGAERFLVEYFGIISDFCSANRDVNVLLKPKNDVEYEKRLTRINIERFRNIWDELMSYENFTCLDDSRWGIGEIIAISDVCINMGMNSPATIALICGKDALYFDSTGNNRHPFAAKYKNKIVFEDKDGLFQQIENILNGKFKCHDVISEKEIREYDAFSDDNALDRIKEYIYQLTKS
jgi:polysaccharide biosynthesis PFTS motif protein